MTGGPDFAPAALAAFLRGFLGRAVDDLTIRATAGGMSNPTYFVQTGNWRAVLRKQPGRALAKSAHAIDREFRVLRALDGSDVPVPQAYHYHDDASVLGTPFYLMEWIDGRVMDGYALPGVPVADRAALLDSMARTMAALHAVDPGAVGLADYGRPGNFFARQLSRWSQLWAQYRNGDDDNPALDRLIGWLEARVPDDQTSALFHGDFRIGNLMFHPTEPRVVAVLDWELSTLGHPMADVAFNVQAWSMAPDENGGLLGLDLPSLGLPDQDAYLATYYAAATRPDRLTDFHRAFALFRGAVGSAGVAVRGAAGNSTLPDSARIGQHLARAYARRGLAIALTGDPAHDVG